MIRQSKEHDNSKNDNFEWAVVLGEEIGEVHKAVLENSNLKEELIHSIAVAVSWLETLE